MMTINLLKFSENWTNKSKLKLKEFLDQGYRELKDGESVRNGYIYFDDKGAQGFIGGYEHYSYTYNDFKNLFGKAYVVLTTKPNTIAPKQYVRGM